MTTKPDSERIESAIQIINEELGNTKYFEISHYQLNNGKYYTIFHCPEKIPDVKSSPQNKYKLKRFKIGENTTTSLAPLNKY